MFILFANSKCGKINEARNYPLLGTLLRVCQQLCYIMDVHPISAVDRSDAGCYKKYLNLPNNKAFWGLKHVRVWELWG